MSAQGSTGWRRTVSTPPSTSSPRLPPNPNHRASHADLSASRIRSGTTFKTAWGEHAILGIIDRDSQVYEATVPSGATDGFTHEFVRACKEDDNGR